MTFPSNFLWGVATAGYQVEGGIRNNDWAHFVNNPEIVNRVYGIGAFAGQEIRLSDPGEALNHQDFDVFASDLDRAVALGATAYRMSVEWSRLQPLEPANPRELDATGVAFYAQRIEAVLQRGMVLHLTLNHLTLPAWVLTPPVATTVASAYGLIGPRVAIADSEYLAHRGWESIRTTELFANYAAAVVGEYHSRFADRGQIFWATFNEPVGSMIGVGYFAGIWPPGFSLDGGRGRTAYFNLLRAHILAYDAIKEASGGAAQVGIVHNMMHTQRTTVNAVPSTVREGTVGGTVTGAIVGGVVGTASGAALGAAACGPLCALFGGLIGLVVGVIVGGAAGTATGAIVGAISAAGVNSRHEDARQKFDYFFNEHLLNALVLGRVDGAISADESGRRIMDIREFISAGEFSPTHGARPRPDVPNHSRLDFLGINYYRTVFVYHDVIFAGRVPYAGGVFKDDLRRTEETPILVNDLGWGIHADGLEQIVTRVHRTYSQPGAPLPIIIAENGCPENADKLRAPYTVAHLEALERAMQEVDAELGPPRVLGYIHWTLADNYEWHHGYNDNSRFGLFTIDRQLPNERRITEGAFAFHALARSRDTNIAKIKFGTLERNVPMIVEPSESPGALWVGEVDGASARLWLTRISSVSIQGLLCYPDHNQWVRVDGVEYDPESRRIAFSHNALPGIPARRFTATVRETGFESGAYTDSWPSHRGAEGMWYAERDPLVGLWIPTAQDREAAQSWDPTDVEGWKMLSLERWDRNQWRAKMLWRRCTWESILVRDETVAGITTLTWSGTNGQFVASLVATPLGNLLQGRIRPTRYWPAAFLFEASRIPDGLPF
jgi:beta-glucosidase/6-phospho-beta-glucosidase/beta-galactosidase